MNSKNFVKEHKNNPDNKLPWLISYPRSGNTWINAMIEVCLDKPRGPLQNGGISWRPKLPHEEFLYVGHHDKLDMLRNSDSEHGDLFLFRNPVDSMYSFQQARLGLNITDTANYYKRLFEKWVGSCKTVLIYEHFVQDPESSLSEVCKHFNLPFDKDRARLAVTTCKKESIMNKPTSEYHNPIVMTEAYQKKRCAFAERYEKEILDIVVTDTTKPWLSKIMKI